MKPHILILSAIVFVACGSDSTKENDSPISKLQQGEQWSAKDNPELFTGDLERKLDALPESGEAKKIPWAGSYWPTYQDSINYRWAGPNSDSPAKKYEKAFNGSKVEDAVSRYYGIDGLGGYQCVSSFSCPASTLCAFRRGATLGKCVSTWWGICHGWVPAAILLPEPKHPVTKNGVTFNVQDIKALASLVYTSVEAKFVSSRCNKTNNEIDYDANGRPDNNSAECRDTNAGTYHLLLANYLGKMGLSFAEDRTFNYQVWNQPLRSYRVLEKQAVSASEANRLVGTNGNSGDSTVIKRSGQVRRRAWSHQGSFTVAAGNTVKVVMTGAGDPDLYVRFGSQPDLTHYDCRPYLNGASETCQLKVPDGVTSVFVSVNGYAAYSTFSLQIIIPSGSSSAGYAFDANAVSFAYLKTEVQYIGESDSTTDGNLSGNIDQYTYVDNYEYVLEMDDSGNVIGGEWVGDSKTNHPDFLWLPVKASSSTVAGGAISYDAVKALVDDSMN